MCVRDAKVEIGRCSVSKLKSLTVSGKREKVFEDCNDVGMDC